jgi:cytochrome c peroxidase
MVRYTNESSKKSMALAITMLAMAGYTAALAGAGAPPPPVTSPAPPAPPASPAPPVPPAPPGAAAPIPDETGAWMNASLGAPANQNAPFFERLGSNGRSCASCHVENDAWTSTPANLQRRFQNTAGADPIFASVDGTNCSSLDISTPSAHEAASSLLLSKGLIRVALIVPSSAAFSVTDVVNPYGCDSTSVVSVYRRIPTTANLTFLSTVMWDGRESLTNASIPADLVHQAGTAVSTHEAAATLPAVSVLQAIETFEVAQFAAQTTDASAGALNAAGATGGPLVLSTQAVAPGANDPFTPGAATPGVPPKAVFTLYTAWSGLQGTDSVSKARASIARGEQLFNTRPMSITGVAGLNDSAGANGLPRTVINGTCGTCHDTPNAGSHSVQLLVDIGTADATRRTPDMPLITLINRTTGATRQTTDPGLALTTGRWADVNKFKIPTLRLLAAQAPFFHDGSAPTLDAVVNFYDQRFGLKLSAQEHADLVAFLGAL